MDSRNSYSSDLDDNQSRLEKQDFSEQNDNESSTLLQESPMPNDEANKNFDKEQDKNLNEEEIKNLDEDDKLSSDEDSVEPAKQCQTISPVDISTLLRLILQHLDSHLTGILRRSYCRWRRKCYSEKRHEFKRLISNHINTLFSKKTDNRSNEYKECIRELLLDLYPIQSIFQQLSDEHLNILANEISIQKYIKRKLLFLQESYSDCAYILVSGKIELFYQNEHRIDAPQSIAVKEKLFEQNVLNIGTLIKTLAVPTIFGEGLLHETDPIHACSAVIQPPSFILTIPHNAYFKTLAVSRHKEEYTGLCLDLLSESKLFESCRKAKLKTIASNMTYKEIIGKGEIIVEECDNIDSVFLVVHGEVVTCTKDSINDEQFHPKTRMKQGALAGEKELLAGKTKFDLRYSTLSESVVIGEIDVVTVAQYCQIHISSDFLEKAAPMKRFSVLDDISMLKRSPSQVSLGSDRLGPRPLVHRDPSADRGMNVEGNEKFLQPLTHNSEKKLMENGEVASPSPSVSVSSPGGRSITSKYRNGGYTGGEIVILNKLPPSNTHANQLPPIAHSLPVIAHTDMDRKEHQSMPVSPGSAKYAPSSAFLGSVLRMTEKNVRPAHGDNNKLSSSLKLPSSPSCTSPVISSLPIHISVNKAKSGTFDMSSTSK